VLLAAAVVKACALLTAAEVASVLGEKPIKIRQATPRRDASQCFMALPAPTKSVTLEVTRGPRATQLADRLRAAAEVEGGLVTIGRSGQKDAWWTLTYRGRRQAIGPRSSARTEW